MDERTEKIDSATAMLSSIGQLHPRFIKQLRKQIKKEKLLNLQRKAFKGNTK